MSFSSLLVDYLGEGLASARPAELEISPATVGFWFATDTSVLSAWNGSAWVTITTGGGGGTGTVTSVTAGTGLAGGTITTSGTISLGTIANDTVLGNVSGSTAVPIALTQAQLTALVQVFASSLPGAVPASGGGTTNFLRADGTWAAPPGGGGGSITGVTAGTGLAGGGTSGDVTLSLASIATNTVLGNVTGASASPVGLTGTQLTSLVQDFTSSLSGAVPASGGGTVNFLRADGTWDTPPGGGGGSGTVTQVNTGTGLTGGPVTTTGTVSLAPITNDTLLANTSGASAAPVPTALSAVIDASMGSAEGDILVRGASAWQVLAPGTAGQVLTTGGAGALPSWAAGGGGGGSGSNVPIFPASIFVSDATGDTVLGYYTGSGGNASPTEFGLQIVASLPANSVVEMRFPMPTNAIPSGTLKLRVWGLAAATTGTAGFTVADGRAAAGLSPSAATLTAETASSLPWTTADIYNEVKVPLSTVVQAKDMLVVAVTFNTSGWTLAAQSTWLFAAIWE